MELALPDMDDAQRSPMAPLVAAIRTNDVQSMRPAFAAVSGAGVWTSPPLLAASAALIRVLTAELDGRPWEVSEDLWMQDLPDRRPEGRAGQRKATFALQAVGCLAAGVWLDVGTIESFWSSPMWPEALDVVELLTVVVLARTSVLSEQLADRVSALLRASPALPPIG